MKNVSLGSKILFVFFLFVLSISQIFGQAPQAFNYQGVARDGSGEAIKSQLINLRISILNGESGESLQYQEEQTVTTSDRGIFSLRIGEGLTTVGTFSDIDWTQGAYFIRTEIDPAGGQSFIDLGSSQLYSVPFALYANRAGNSDTSNEAGTTSWVEDDGDLVYSSDGKVIYRKADVDQWLVSSDDDGGYWNMYDENGLISLFAFTWSSGTGFLGTAGPNGNTNVRLSTISGLPNNGFLAVADADGNSRVGAYVRDSGSGDLFTEGPSGNLNAFITNTSGQPDHGYLAVYDADENQKAGIYIDDEGQGRVFADFVDSFVDNPDKAGEKIVYTMIQGPESAAYLRGTATLENGTASIDFPSHFSNLILSDNITVQITPLSAKSKGIAVIKKGVSGFRVQELLDGQGSYSFDWEVKGIRKDHLEKSRGTPSPYQPTTMPTELLQEDESKARSKHSSDRGGK